MLDVTVCILSYQRLGFLRETVASVLGQTSVPARIAIFDNGSDTDVHDGVLDYLETGVQWFGSDMNNGVLWNIRRAIQSIDTSYYVILHDDDRLNPDFLRTQVEMMELNPDWSAVSCNGYFIDDAGKRTGNTLSRIPKSVQTEVFDCSGRVAMKYAGNSCIPFSPALYRLEKSNTVSFREDFGKVLDATYFCDLSDRGPIGYQCTPLYESRLHGGQDSTSFSIGLSNRLEEFFATRLFKNESERVRLLKSLERQHTERNLKMFAVCLRSGRTAQAWELVTDPKFRLIHALTSGFRWFFRMLRSGGAGWINRTAN